MKTNILNIFCLNNTDEVDECAMCIKDNFDNLFQATYKNNKVSWMYCEKCFIKIFPLDKFVYECLGCGNHNHECLGYIYD